MKGIVYGEADETKYGEDSYYIRTRFYCIDGKIHIIRDTTYTDKNAPVEEFGRPTPCDGSCRQTIPLPRKLKGQLQDMLAHSPGASRKPRRK